MSNSLWLGFDYTGVRNLRVINKLKFDVTNSNLDKEERRIRGLVQNEHFFGVINKVGYQLKLGRLELEPRWKSEYRHQSRDLISTSEREELGQLASLLGRATFLDRSVIEGGVEFLWTNDLQEDQNDLNSRVLALQVTNRKDYLGYKLTTQIGVKFDRRKPKGEKATTTQESYILVFAGLN